MFILGHVGLTATAAHAVDRGSDLRLAALMAVLPDLIDKPAYLAFPGLFSGNTRGFGHTFVAAFAVAAVLAVLRRRRGDWALLSVCYAAHMLLDLGWTSNHPRILLWPLLGPLPPPVRESYLPVFVFYNLAGEILGAVLILLLVRRHRLLEPARLRAFALGGRLSG